MTNNLFFAGEQDIGTEIITVNNRNIEKFILSSKEEGYFFYYRKKKKELYYAKIRTINKLQSKDKIQKTMDEFSCILKLKNVFFQINFESNIKKESLYILKDVYAKRNADVMGNRSSSIFYSLNSNSFKYALPVIDETLFMKPDIFLDKILYEGSIIPIESEERKNFAKIVNEDGQFSLSLMNELMLEIDRRFLLNELTDLKYRPYFYEFFLDEDQRDFLNESIANNTYAEGQLYEVELFNINEKSVKRNPNEIQEQVFKGQIMFSASPTRHIPAYLKILHTEIEDSIINTYNQIDELLKEKAELFREEKLIMDRFMENIPLSADANMDINYEITVFNVGQGNWIHISVYEGDNLVSKIIFDIGIGSKINRKLRDDITSRAAEEIKDNYFFMLSHWDLDHIKGVTELKRNQFETTWIVPEISNDVSQSAKRLAAFLIINTNVKQIFVSNTLNGRVIFKNTYFELGKGYGNGEWHECKICKKRGKKGCEEYRKDVSYTGENNLGLILIIRTKDNKMLFPGDCEYIQFPEEFIKKDYDAIVLSHHGAKIKQKSLESLGFRKSGKDKFAIACVGEENKDKSKNYPDENHEKAIAHLGFKLNKTRDYNDANKPCRYKLN